MGKSYRRDSFYRCSGANPAAGKARANRKIRRAVRDMSREIEGTSLEDIEGKTGCVLPTDFYKDDPTDTENLVITRDPADFFLDNPQDKNRGKAGSRSPDLGWDDFGDGRIVRNFDKTGRK